MSIFELQLAPTRMNTLLRELLHERFLQVNPFDAPYDPTYLVHHIEIPDFSFTPSSGTVQATIQPRAHVVPFADILTAPNLVAPPTNAAIMSVTLTISVDSNKPSQLLVQGTSTDLSNLTGFLTTTQIQALQQAVQNLSAPIDLTQFLPMPLLAGVFSFQSSGVSADATHIAARFDSNTADPTFSGFLAGTFADHLHGQDWASFITQDILVGDVNVVFTKILNGVNAVTIVEGPNSSWSAPPPTVNTAFSIDVNVDENASNVNIFLDLNIASVFKLAPFVKKTQQGLVHVFRLDATFSVSPGNPEVAILLGVLGINPTQALGQKLKGKLPSGVTQIASNEIASDNDMPLITILNAPGFQTAVTGDADGIEILGDIQPNFAQDAEFTPAVSQFLWAWTDFCSDHSSTKGAYLKQVKSHASAILGALNTPLINRPIHIWYLRQFVPPLPPATIDPVGAFASYLSMPSEGADVTAVDIDIAFTAEDFAAYHADYWNSPYPCTLLCATSAGTIFLSLGQVDTLDIDPQTGIVKNAITIYVNDCHYVAVDPWYLYFRNFNPSWSIDPYIGERFEQAAGSAISGEILSIQLAGADAGETITVETQDMAARTSVRVVLADRSGKAQFTAYLPTSANPTPLRVTRARNAEPLRLAGLQRTLLAQAIRLAMAARIERIAGEVAHGRSLLHVTTVSGMRTFDVSDPGHPQTLEGGHQMKRSGIFGRSRARAGITGITLPEGLVQIGEVVATIDARQNCVALFRSQTYRDASVGV